MPTSPREPSIEWRRIVAVMAVAAAFGLLTFADGVTADTDHRIQAIYHVAALGSGFLLYAIAALVRAPWLEETRIRASACVLIVVTSAVALGLGFALEPTLQLDLADGMWIVGGSFGLAAIGVVGWFSPRPT